MLRRFRERMRGGFGGGDDGDGGEKRRFNLFGAAGGLLVAVWIASGIYVVDAGEQAVVTQFGAYHQTRGPGLHFHLPTPIESKTIVPFALQQRISLPASDDNRETADSLMITGDRNIVDVNFVVLWRVADSQDFVFNVQDVEATIRTVAESAMREVVGQRELQALITTDRAPVEQAVEALMQAILNSYEAGVQIQAVQLQRVVAPAAVIDAFDDVVRAGQDRQTVINQAEQYRNEQVPQARGRAQQQIELANGYAEQVVREANGEAARFLSVYEQYRLAPRVTRERLYLETMERVYGNADTVIIDGRVGVAPYLPLQELRRNARTPPPQPSGSAAPPRAGGQ